MAAWIKSHQTLKRHPKLIRFAARLGVSRATAIGHLHALWYDVLDYAEDGDITGIEPEVLAEWGLWGGEPKAFRLALVDFGFIDDDADGARIHDWEDYAGELLRRRQRQRAFRSRSRDATVTPPSRSCANIEKSREEKSREEETREECAAEAALFPSLTAAQVEALPSSPKIRADDSRMPEDCREFLRLWRSHPSRRNSSPRDVWVWWLRRPSGFKPSVVLADVAERVKHDEWTRDAGAAKPLEITYLNQKQWERPLPEHTGARHVADHEDYGDGGWGGDGGGDA